MGAQTCALVAVRNNRKQLCRIDWSHVIQSVRIAAKFETMSLDSGAKLGRYEIRSKLGEGGMGEVYRAFDPKINREVAIKILPPALSADKDESGLGS